MGTVSRLAATPTESLVMPNHVALVSQSVCVKGSALEYGVSFLELYCL